MKAATKTKVAMTRQRKVMQVEMIGTFHASMPNWPKSFFNKRSEMTPAERQQMKSVVPKMVTLTINSRDIGGILRAGNVRCLL